MNEKFKAMLDKEFSEWLNEDKAERHIKIAIRVLAVAEKFEKATCPYAVNEICAVEMAKEALEALEMDEE